MFRFFLKSSFYRGIWLIWHLASHKNHRNYGNFSHFIDCTMYSRHIRVLFYCTWPKHFISFRFAFKRIFHRLRGKAVSIHFRHSFCSVILSLEFSFAGISKAIFDCSFKKECSQFSLNFLVLDQQCRHTQTLAQAQTHKCGWLLK